MNKNLGLALFYNYTEYLSNVTSYNNQYVKQLQSENSLTSFKNTRKFHSLKGKCIYIALFL